MINQKLHARPAALDRDQHRSLTLGQQQSWKLASRLNSIFVAAVEFGDIAREYPLVFVNAGKDDAGRDQIAPVAIFGLATDENLYLDGDRWRADYLPAALRMYPFGLGRIDAERYALCIDMDCPFLTDGPGQRLFQDDGKPTEYLDSVHEQLRKLEAEVQRTRLFCQMLADKGLLRDMRFDAELPGGQKLVVDGFLTVDEKKLAELSDADVLALHRNGALGLLHAHMVSLGHMRRLVGWRMQAAAPAPAAA